MREERLGNLTAGDKSLADWKSVDEVEVDVGLEFLDDGETSIGVGDAGSTFPIDGNVGARATGGDDMFHSFRRILIGNCCVDDDVSTIVEPDTALALSWLM